MRFGNYNGLKGRWADVMIENTVTRPEVVFFGRIKYSFRGGVVINDRWVPYSKDRYIAITRDSWGDVMSELYDSLILSGENLNGRK